MFLDQIKKDIKRWEELTKNIKLTEEELKEIKKEIQQKINRR